MTAIISRAVNGTFAEVGTSDRMLVSLKTEQGVIRRGRKYAQGKTFRVEFFHSEHLYGNPYRTLVVLR